MVEAFYSKYARKRTNRQPGNTALIVKRPEPVYSNDGTVFFFVRFAIREARTYTNTNRSKYNRLAVKRFKSTYYEATRFEYAYFQWGSTSEPPVLLGRYAHPSLPVLKAALAEYERG